MAFAVSRPTKYAIRALIYLAGLPASESATVARIAKAESIPAPFLAKVMKRLADSGIVDSSRGPNGGVRLARPPHRISVFDVIECLEDEASRTQCFLGLKTCNERAPCTMHDRWKELRARTERELRNATIARLSR